MQIVTSFFLEKITSINENIFSFFYKRYRCRAFPLILHRKLLVRSVFISRTQSHQFVKKDDSDHKKS